MFLAKTSRIIGTFGPSASYLVIQKTPLYRQIVSTSIIWEMYRRGAATKDHNNKPVKKDVSDSDKYADLLVFGYACKLFRDDERALYHEHGKHLIPWMGDKSIMIDRSVEQT